MDPHAALIMFLQACKDDSKDEALTAVESLVDWIKHGGFLPNVSPSESQYDAHTTTSGRWVVGDIC